MNLTFTILCPDCNTGGLKNTVSSIKILNPEFKINAIVAKNAHKDNVKELSRYANIVIAGNTITSLIDKGMSNGWNICLFSGSWVRRGSLNKYFYFTKSDKDILFPVIDMKWQFHEASMNGLLIHKNAIKEIGEFGNERDLEVAKLFWANKAIEKGYKFKAIVGAKFL